MAGPGGSDSTAVLFPVLMQCSHGSFLLAKLKVHLFIQLSRKMLVPICERFRDRSRKLRDLNQVVLDSGHQLLLLKAGGSLFLRLLSHSRHCLAEEATPHTAHQAVPANRTKSRLSPDPAKRIIAVLHMVVPQAAKTRDAIQEQLLADVQRTQKLYLEDRNDVTRKNFMDALRRFNGLVVYEKLPE